MTLPDAVAQIDDLRGLVQQLMLVVSALQNELAAQRNLLARIGGAINSALPSKKS